MNPREHGELRRFHPHIRRSTLRRVGLASLAAGAVIAAGIVIAGVDPGGIMSAGMFQVPLLGDVSPVSVVWSTLTAVAGVATGWRVWASGARPLEGEQASGRAELAPYVSVLDGKSRPVDQPYLYARPDLVPAPSIIRDGSGQVAIAVLDAFIALVNVPTLALHLASGDLGLAALNSVTVLVWAGIGAVNLAAAHRKAVQATARSVSQRQLNVPCATPRPSRVGIGRGPAGTVAGMEADDSGPRWIDSSDILCASDGILWIRSEAPTHLFRGGAGGEPARVRMTPAGADVVLDSRSVRQGEPGPDDIPVSSLALHHWGLGHASASSWELR